ncbi:S41 family peptidase [Paenibacillus sp. JJ1722]|uniref:S41 family peptidase n=1 Tax=Paenibacillus sp. JJ1722 TaxID=3398770 RepID=UPI003AADC22C
MAFLIETFEPIIEGAITLANFNETFNELTLEERRKVVDQAIVMIESIYVHLPQKKAIYAIDPVQNLKNLRRQLHVLTEREFHSEMIKIFKQLRDRHTNYFLPAPYNKFSAFLPFLMKEYYDADNERHYIVTDLTDGVNHETFVIGVEITDWNGVPIDQAVALNAEREDGSNKAARHVRGLDAMTVRPMLKFLPPDEHWVIIGYRSNNQNYKIQIPWQVKEFIPDVCINPPVTEQFVADYGIDLTLDLTNSIRKTLFARNTTELIKKTADYKNNTNNKESEVFFKSNSRYPCTFQFRTIETSQGELGYLRIWSFMDPEPEPFLYEVIRILELLPQKGLIIDVRRNGGGYISNGERMLQLFSSNRVDAERMHFINKEITLAIANSDFNDGNYNKWAKSIELSTVTGSVYSLGLPLESPDLTNSIGRRYKGDTVLITDASCYSTTDIFIAGFQDNNIGKILGVDDNTGAGGASVVTHEHLKDILFKSDFPLQKLPNDIKMRVALLQSRRVGDNTGLPLEDLGTQPDVIHRMTRDDVLHDNRDLIAAAAKLLLQSSVQIYS